MSVFVLGGANADLSGRSLSTVRHGDSNPAVISLSAGGVSRNIAENLARLGADVEFATTAGDDAFARFLRETCAGAGIEVSNWVIRPGLSTGIYMAGLDERGELYVALNDMAAVMSITPREVGAFAPLMRGSALVVLDANLPDAALAAAFDAAGGTPVMCDSVSAPKAARLVPHIGKISILKTNRAELAALTSLPCGGESGLRDACGALLDAGAGEVYVTLGTDGAFWARRGGCGFVPAAAPERIKSVTGAGVAFAAGVAFGFLRGLGHEARARMGSACAALALESDGAVNPELTAGRALALAGIQIDMTDAL